MASKILILTADVGNGHRTTAQALVEAFKQKHGENVKVIDLFETLDIAPFNTSAASYELFSRNHTLQSVSNFFFRLFNTDVGFLGFRSYALARLLQPARELIEHEAPQIIISNHPIVSVILSELKRSGMKFFSVTAVVDIGTIWRSWADQYADLIISPSSEVSDQLVRAGVSTKSIHTGLFPVRQSLRDFKQKEIVCAELNLDPAKKIILVTGGGLGANIMLKCVDNLIQRSEWQIVVVCGRLESLADQLKQNYADKTNLFVLGYVPRMQDLYNAADLIVAKPGPSTIIEIELFQKPALLSWEIGEQEIGNIAYAEQTGHCIGLNGQWWKTAELAEQLMNATPSKSTARHNFHESSEITQLILSSSSI